MPFVKGNKEASKKGKHQKTKQWEQLGESILTTHTERFNEILDNCDDETFIKNYTAILEYFKPKQARTEISGQVEISPIKQLIFEPASQKDKR